MNKSYQFLCVQIYSKKVIFAMLFLLFSPCFLSYLPCKYTKGIYILQIILNKKKKKVINKKLGEAREKAYIERNIKIKR